MNDPEWKIVRYKDPRSRRVIGEVPESSLSAPGRPDATVHATRFDRTEEEFRTEPVAVHHVDVDHVMAHEEPDDDLGYADTDHQDNLSESDDEVEQNNTANAVQLDDVIDDH